MKKHIHSEKIEINRLKSMKYLKNNKHQEQIN